MKVFIVLFIAWILIMLIVAIALRRKLKIKKEEMIMKETIISEKLGDDFQLVNREDINFDFEAIYESPCFSGFKLDDNPIVNQSNGNISIVSGLNTGSDINDKKQKKSSGVYMVTGLETIKNISIHVSAEDLKAKLFKGEKMYSYNPNRNDGLYVLTSESIDSLDLLETNIMEVIQDFRRKHGDISIFINKGLIGLNVIHDDLSMINDSSIIFDGFEVMDKIRREVRRKKKEKDWYDYKHKKQKKWQGLRSRNLEVVDITDIIVKDKAIVESSHINTSKEKRKGDGDFYLYLETINKEYDGMMEIKRQEYGSFKKGETLEGRVVLRSIKNPEFIIMTNEKNAKDAIKSVTFKAKVHFSIIGLAIVSLLVVATVMIISIP